MTIAKGASLEQFGPNHSVVVTAAFAMFAPSLLAGLDHHAGILGRLGAMRPAP